MLVIPRPGPLVPEGTFLEVGFRASVRVCFDSDAALPIWERRELALKTPARISWATRFIWFGGMKKWVSFLGHKMASWGSMLDTKVGLRDMVASTIDSFPVSSIKDYGCL